MTRAKKTKIDKDSRRAAASWITHDGEAVKVAKTKIALIPLSRDGALMCLKCGHRSDVPAPHFAIMSIECDGSAWGPYVAPSWDHR